MEDHRISDEVLLIDYILGRCTDEQSAVVARRLAEDAAFRKLHGDLANTFAAVEALPEITPPEDLAERTVERLRRIRATEALIAREEISRRAPSRRVFSLRDIVAAVAAVIVVGFVLLSSGGDIMRGLRGTNQAMMNLCLANQKQIGQAIQSYAEANNGYLPISAPAQRQWLADGDQQVASNSEGLYRLIDGGYADQGVFQCPGSTGGKAASFVRQAGMTDFPAGEFVGYSYQYALGRAPSVNDPALRAAVAEMAILADSNPLFAGGRFRPSRVNTPVSDNHHRRGQNVLYLDAHAQWSQSPAAGVGGNNIYLVDGILNYTGNEAPAGPADTFLLPTYSPR